MYCLLKMSTISRKGHSPHQQMFCHRNHRNLLFLCHPFRANYSMKTNNSAKCCLLLDNLANKKCIIIQSRRLRFKVKGSENTSSNSTDDENEEENVTENSKIDLQQILSKFKSKFDNEITYRKIIFSPIRVLWDNSNGYKEFVDNFNKEHAKSGYKIERDKKTFYKFHTLLSFPIMLLFQFVSLYVLHSLWLAYNNMKREHGPIMAQPSITFNQFAQDYLPSGEIDKIIHYPWKKLLVVLLHPGALINGEPFTAPGLHVKLDAFLLVGQLTQRIREEERRIGVRDSIPIIDSDNEFLELNQSKIIFLYIVPGIILYALKKMMLKQFWLVIPINSKKKGMMKKGK